MIINTTDSELKMYWCSLTQRILPMSSYVCTQCTPLCNDVYERVCFGDLCHMFSLHHISEVNIFPSCLHTRGGSWKVKDRRHLKHVKLTTQYSKFDRRIQVNMGDHLIFKVGLQSETETKKVRQRSWQMNIYLHWSIMHRFLVFLGGSDVRYQVWPEEGVHGLS